MKIHVIIRTLTEQDWLNRTPNIFCAYCGYLEADPYSDLWNWCNWSCWSENKPKECQHLLIGHCNSDVSFIIDGRVYSHDTHKFFYRRVL